MSPATYLFRKRQCCSTLDFEFWRGRHAANGYLDEEATLEWFVVLGVSIRGTMVVARAMAMALAWAMPMALAIRVESWKHWFGVALIGRSCEVPM